LLPVCIVVVVAVVDSLWLWLILLFCVYTQTFFHVALFGHIFRLFNASSALWMELPDRWK